MARPVLSALVALLAIAAGSPPGIAADSVLVRMATGAVNAVYFPVGVSLCRVVNTERPAHGVRCSALPSGGSVDNVAMLRAGEVEAAIIQSDVQEAAWLGEGVFAGAGPDDSLRALLALHPEPLTVVSRRADGIVSIGDLRGKRISYGSEGSGVRAVWDTVMDASGWSAADFGDVPDTPAADLAEALCAGSIDAFVVAVGHPARSVQEATLGCDAVLVPVEGPAVDELVAGRQVYFPAEIPGGLYKGNPDSVPTFGVGATLVTAARMPDTVVEVLVTRILDSLEDLRAFEPALSNLDPAAMANAGRTAPLHPAAERVLRGRGLLDDIASEPGGG